MPSHPATYSLPAAPTSAPALWSVGPMSREHENTLRALRLGLQEEIASSGEPRSARLWNQLMAWERALARILGDLDAQHLARVAR